MQFQLQIDVPRWHDLFDTLPTEVKLDLRHDPIIEQLYLAYLQEHYMLLNQVMSTHGYKEDSQGSYSIHMDKSFSNYGDQMLCNFQADDLSLPRGTSVNFHGMNLSRSIYAGGILLARYNGKYSVSTHH